MDLPVCVGSGDTAAFVLSLVVSDACIARTERCCLRA